MKSKTRLISFFLALVLLLSISMAVSASPAPEMNTVSSGEIVVLEGNDNLEEAEGPNIEVPDDPESVPAESPEQESEEAETQEAPEPQRSSNTPFFVGAVIALIVFVGVAIYCKANGNKIY